MPNVEDVTIYANKVTTVFEGSLDDVMSGKGRRVVVELENPQVLESELFVFGTLPSSEGLSLSLGGDKLVHLLLRRPGWNNLAALLRVARGEAELILKNGCHEVKTIISCRGDYDALESGLWCYMHDHKAAA